MIYKGAKRGTRYVGHKCVACGNRTRYANTGGCVDCNQRRNDKRRGFVAARPYRTELLDDAYDVCVLPVPRRGDESGGWADYYRGPYFTKCELCGHQSTEDGVLCGTCSRDLVDCPTREIEMRLPDVSDVARRLQEMYA